MKHPNTRFCFSEAQMGGWMDLPLPLGVLRRPRPQLPSLHAQASEPPPRLLEPQVQRLSASVSWTPPALHPALRTSHPTQCLAPSTCPSPGSPPPSPAPRSGAAGVGEGWPCCSQGQTRTRTLRAGAWEGCGLGLRTLEQIPHLVNKRC